MKMEIIKEKEKGFIFLIQAMICDKKLWVTKQFCTALDGTGKKAAFWNSALSVQIYMKKS